MTFDDIVAVLLPEIDETLASCEAPLLGRPHRAASFIVKHCIVEIEGESKDDYYTKPWFGALLAAVIDWYDNLYGEAMSSGTAQCHTAVVVIRETPTALEVPLTLSTPVAEDNTFWITLAASVHAEENPLDWVVRPPRLSELSQEQLEQATSAAALTSNLVRRTSNGLLMVGNQNKRVLEHAGLVLPHLQSSAQSILQPDRRGLSTAIWEANFAAENAIKCYLRQVDAPKVPNSHDVQELDSLIRGVHRPPELDIAVSGMPSGNHAVKYRYGAIGNVRLSDAMRVYQGSLVICAHYANAVPPKKFRLDNARFQMRVPPMPPKKPG